MTHVMNRLEVASEMLETAIDEEDIELICEAINILTAICSVIQSGRLNAPARRDPQQFSIPGAFDLDELGIDPEEEVAAWRRNFGR